LLGRFNFGANISERETQGLGDLTTRDSPERKWLMNKRRPLRVSVSAHLIQHCRRPNSFQLRLYYHII